MSTATCPTCKKKVQYEQMSDLPAFPFCSDRCKLVDLGRWIDGSYLVSRELNEDEIEEFEQIIEERMGQSDSEY